MAQRLAYFKDIVTKLPFLAFMLDLLNAGISEDMLDTDLQAKIDSTVTVVSSSGNIPASQSVTVISGSGKTATLPLSSAGTRPLTIVGTAPTNYTVAAVAGETLLDYSGDSEASFAFMGVPTTWVADPTNARWVRIQ